MTVQSPDWLPLGLVCVICKLWVWDVFHDTECPIWDQVPLNNIQNSVMPICILCQLLWDYEKEMIVSLLLFFSAKIIAYSDSSKSWPPVGWSQITSDL